MIDGKFSSVVTLTAERKKFSVHPMRIVKYTDNIQSDYATLSVAAVGRIVLPPNFTSLIKGGLQEDATKNKGEPSPAAEKIPVQEFKEDQDEDFSTNNIEHGLPGELMLGDSSGSMNFIEEEEPVNDSSLVPRIDKAEALREVGREISARPGLGYDIKRQSASYRRFEKEFSSHSATAEVLLEDIECIDPPEVVNERALQEWGKKLATCQTLEDIAQLQPAEFVTDIDIGSLTLSVMNKRMENARAAQARSLLYPERESIPQPKFRAPRPHVPSSIPAPFISPAFRTSNRAPGVPVPPSCRDGPS